MAIRLLLFAARSRLEQIAAAVLPINTGERGDQGEPLAFEFFTDDYIAALLCSVAASTLAPAAAFGAGHFNPHRGSRSVDAQVSTP
jgi:hypothetical protein